MKAGFDSVPDGERLLLWHGSRTTNFAGRIKRFIGFHFDSNERRIQVSSSKVCVSHLQKVSIFVTSRWLC